jgi:iron complex outermembrane receptor protein
VSILSNVGQVLTRGAEFEAAAKPLAGLTLHASVGYDQADYGRYANAPCPVEVSGRTICDLSGRPVVGAPRWTANFYGGYEHPIVPSLIGYARAEYGWRSRYYGYQDDSALTVTGNYALINLYAGIRDASGRWDLMFWGKNITDGHHAISFANLGSLVPGAYLPQFGDPATYGVTLRANF